MNTYKPSSFGFGKDANGAYYESHMLKGVDSKSFGELHTTDSIDFVFGDKRGSNFTTGVERNFSKILKYHQEMNGYYLVIVC